MPHILIGATFRICLSMFPCSPSMVCERCVDSVRELRTVRYLGHDLCKMIYRDGGIETDVCLLVRRKRRPEDDVI
jgi:hypothetical protein